MITIAVDAMGGDHAPHPEVAGSLEALREQDVRILLVGKTARIKELLTAREAGGFQNRLEIVHAEEVVTMEDAASSALRKKKNSSLRVAADLVRHGRADGMVSAGNTGAVMATAKLVLGPLKGVDRPAIAAILPTTKGPCLLIDVGANVDCRPEHLEQFAVMGHFYSQQILGIPSPRVALMSIGEESSKGNDLTRQVFQALQTQKLNFIGNVEGRDIYHGKADVVACDGFVGNVILKVSESLAELFVSMLKEELSRSLTTKVGALLSKRAFRGLKKRIDYSEYGGAPLLGVKGACIICHGRSNPNAIKNAIRVAREFCENQINHRIESNLTAMLSRPARAEAREETTEKCTRS